MARYIELDALVAEIEKLESKNYKNSNEFNLGAATYLGIFKHFLNTLEVKEVDLEKEIGQSFVNLDYHLDAYNRVEDYVGENIDMVEYKRIAKYFFELGLKAQKGEKA